KSAGSMSTVPTFSPWRLYTSSVIMVSCFPGKNISRLAHPLTPNPSPPLRGRGEQQIHPSPLGGEGLGVRGGARFSPYNAAGAAPVRGGTRLILGSRSGCDEGSEPVGGTLLSRAARFTAGDGAVPEF